MKPFSCLTIEDVKLENYEFEDIYDVIQLIEKSFGIQIQPTAFEKVQNFGDLSDVIFDHIPHPHKDGCTSQQAFYRIREALSTTSGITLTLITPGTRLEKLFPKSSRKDHINLLQKNLGINFSILTYPGWVTYFSLGLLTISLILFFIDWKIALAGISLFIPELYFADKTANKLKIHTVRDLTELLAREHYMHFRRTPGTANRQEIFPVIRDCFEAHLGIDQKHLTRKARII